MKWLLSNSIIGAKYADWPSTDVTYTPCRLKKGVYAVVVNRVGQASFIERFRSIGYTILFECEAYNAVHDESHNQLWMCIFEVEEGKTYPTEFKNV